MPPALADADVTLRRVRIAGASGDPLRLRLDVDRLLASADVAPGRLAPAAILVVRSLSDPLPGGLDTRAPAAGPAWQRAVAAALDDHVTRAVRSADGALAATSDAILFADRAELLAGAAADWCRGSLGVRWWWRTLGLCTPQAVLHAFGESAEALPAAMERLAGMGLAAPFAARLAPAEAAALVRAAAAAFGVKRAAEAALAEPPRPAASSARPQPAASARVRTVAAPWQGCAPEAERAGLFAFEHATLVGLLLALRRRPDVLRAPGFCAAARAWRAAAVAPAARRVAASTGDAQEPAMRPRAQAVAPVPEPLEAAAHAENGALAAPADATEREGADRLAPSAPDAVTRQLPRRDDLARSRPPSAWPRGAEPARPVAPAGPAAAPSPDDPSAATAPWTRMSGALPEPGSSSADTIHTRLGGLLHLVLVAQELGFYGDFTTPDRPGIKLDVWDFVALVGRRLAPRSGTDPAWRLLAELAGRAAGEAPGRGFVPPRSWRIPRTRLAPFGSSGTWRHAERAGRLLLVHPRGFAVLDAAGAELGREVRRYRAARARPLATPPAERAPLERWVEHAAAYVRARLAVALGVRARAAPGLALRRPALIYVTDTSVDVVSDLVDLPIEVRLAGLDRDPGFIPAAGRSLRFHFR